MEFSRRWAAFDTMASSMILENAVSNAFKPGGLENYEVGANKQYPSKEIVRPRNEHGAQMPIECSASGQIAAHVP